MTREEFIFWFEERFALTKNDIYELGQLYDEMTKSQWISVEDELPPKYDSYLTRSSGNVIEITHYNIDGWHTESKGKVTHWMPLPQAPMEGGRE